MIKFSSEEVQQIKKWLLSRQNRDEISNLLGREWPSIHYKIRDLGLSKLLRKKKKERREPAKRPVKLPKIDKQEYEREVQKLYNELAEMLFR